MEGFEGPFKFDIDTDGTNIPWDKLDPKIKQELLADGSVSEDSSKVYVFKIAVLPSDHIIEKHHDWQKVSRVFIQAKVADHSIKISGISPRNKKSKYAGQLDMGFDGRLDVDANLFSMARAKLVISSFTKQNSSEQRMAILSSCTKKIAYWVYSRGWPFIDFTAYVYVAVPNATPADLRHLKVSVKAVRKGNVELTQVGVHDQQVQLA